MKHLFTWLCLLFLGATSYSQIKNPLFEPLTGVVNYNTSELFKPETSPNIISKIPQGYSAFSINKNESSEILKTKNDYIKFSLPYDNKIITILLKKTNITTPDFSIANDRGIHSDIFPGLHYQGVVQGDPSSIVAFSIFNEEIIGMIATKNQTLSFGKLNNETLYVLGKEPMKFLQNWCATTDSILYKPDVVLTPENIETSKCVRVYIEVAYDIYLNKGGLTGATNYILGLYNQSNALYNADNITTSLSQIFVWTSPSPFSGSTSTAKLNSFQNYRTSFNGDVAQLVDLASSLGGVAAGFNAFCGGVSEKMCYSGIDPSYNNVPTYSWSVMVFTHEMGHLFGSRHTHACVWNGNNTAIDGCAGFTEGGCPVPGIPSNGGTIMSYCHLTLPGINFSNGFGPQPGNVIRNRINNATCLNASCCPDNLTISFPVTNPIKYEVNNNITATNLVNTNNGQILFDGGRSVILNPGFSTSTASSFFEAFIDGCGGLRRPIAEKPANAIITYKINRSEVKNNNQYSALPRVYPNPTNGLIYINVKDPAEIPAKIEIHDLTGKLMFTINKLYNLSSIDISNFASGIYIILLKSSNTEERYKIMKY